MQKKRIQPFLWPGRDSVLQNHVVPQRLWGTWVVQIPSGPQASELKSVKTLTPIQRPEEHRQNYIRHIQSLSTGSRCMCFMEIMCKKQWNWGDYAHSPGSSKFCSHWTYASIFRDATFKWYPCFWVTKNIPNSNPSRKESTHFRKTE